MVKKLTCVYQDCPLCGDRGKQVKKLVLDKKLQIKKVSFASPEGQHIIHEAVFGGFKVEFPLFTDGKTFSTDPFLVRNVLRPILNSGPESAIKILFVLIFITFL